ncbi:MAG TPA: signal peptidase II [Anaerolineales bacterium]|nr:signal peptidase II [Anaerolineales bacterium]
MNRTLRDYLILVLPAAVIIGLDQWTKWLVRTNLPFDGAWLPAWLSWLSPYARIVNWSNSGAAFGSFQNGNPVFTVLAVVVIVLIFYYFPRIDSRDWTLRVALVLQLAGAAGNLVDRLFRAKVTDFISIGTFPVFNLADSSITIGVIVLLLGVWLNERAQKKAAMQKTD